MLKVILLLFCCFQMIACDRTATEGQSFLVLKLPASMKIGSARESRKTAGLTTFATGGWGITNPQSLNEIMCYGIAIGGPEDFLSSQTCRDDQGIQVFQAGLLLGAIPQDNTIKIEVPSGLQRVVTVFGFAAQTTADCVEVMSLPTSLTSDLRAKLSQPFILGGAVEDLPPGEFELPISVTFDATKLFSTCEATQALPPPDQTTPTPAPSLNISLNSISPTAGSLVGGNTLSLVGTGFLTGIDSVLVGGNLCANLTVASDVLAQCVLPAHPVGSVDVALVQGSLESRLSAAYSYSALPQLSVADVSVSEALSTATVTVSLDAVSSSIVSFDWTTTDGTAVSPQDFTNSSGTGLNIAAGNLTVTFVVPIINDLIDEADETFSIILSNAVNSSILDGSATLTITDDDVMPSLTMTIPTWTEAAGTINHAVTLSAASGLTVTVDYSLNAGTAAVPTDFSGSTAGTLIFSPGTLVQNIAITIVDDIANEPSENFTIGLNNVANASIATTSVSATITDDDPLNLTNLNSGSGADSSRTAGPSTNYTLGPGNMNLNRYQRVRLANLVSSTLTITVTDSSLFAIGDEVMLHATAAYPETQCGVQLGEYRFSDVTATPSGTTIDINTSSDTWYNSIDNAYINNSATVLFTNTSGYFCFLQVVRVALLTSLTVGDNASLFGTPLNLSAEGGGVMPMRISGALTMGLNAIIHMNADMGMNGFYSTSTSRSGGTAGLFQTALAQQAYQSGGDMGASGGYGGGGGGHGDGSNASCTPRCGNSGFDVLPGSSTGSNDLAASIFMGGSGGTGAFSFGGAGGGIIYIHAKNIVVASGAKIEARGEAPTSIYGNGGGAGGAIHIVTETLTGTLNLSVNGGNGENGDGSSNHPGGGGAGGRIHTIHCAGNGGLSGTFISDLLGGLGGSTAITNLGGEGREGTELIQQPGC